MERVRGGRRQREARAAHGNCHAQSSLGQFLVLQTLWGHMSLPAAQKLAAHAKKDIERAVAGGADFSYSDLNALASLGNGQSNYMQRDLMRKLEPSNFRLYEVRLPMKILEQQPRLYLQHMMLPHETFSTLFHKYPTAWQERVLPSPSAISNFWEQMSEHPLMVNHPVRRRPNWSRLCIPLSFHGDGVPCLGVGKAWGKSMDLLSWASCLATGTTMTTFFYIYGIFLSCYSTGFEMDTMQKFWKIFCWSLHSLCEGEWSDIRM